MHKILKPRAEVQDFWTEQLKERGGYWHHDGNPRRPYALMTTGLISNFYANCSVITKNPELLQKAAEDLLRIFAAVLPRPDVVVGSAYGSITLAYELATQMGMSEAWFTIKHDSGEMELDRFTFVGKHTTNVILAEDTITTGQTTLRTVDEIRKKTADSGGNLLPYIFCLVNRTGKSEIGGFRIISLVEVGFARQWEPGHNPFLGDAPERVKAVRPKQHWDALVREYP